MEPNLTRRQLDNRLARAVIKSPLSVVLAWVQAGARPTLQTLENAAEVWRRPLVFRALLDHLDQAERAALPELMKCQALMDDDDMLDAWLDRLTPAALNECTLVSNRPFPMWFVAFIATPAVDENDQPDRARAARLPHVLAKFRNAGADLLAMGRDPDGIGFWLDDDPHYAALRIVMRIRLQREAEDAAAHAARPMRL